MMTVELSFPSGFNALEITRIELREAMEKPRTDEQILFDEVMGKIDLAKINGKTFTVDGQEIIEKRVGMSSLRGLSDNTLSYLNPNGKLLVYVTFGDECRTLGLRNGTKEIGFIFDRKSQTCTSFIGTEVGSNGDKHWERTLSNKVLADEARVLVGIGF